MVMPGDNIQMTIELITPIAMDEGAPVRDPRRRPHGRRRRRHEVTRITRASNTTWPARFASVSRRSITP